MEWTDEHDVLLLQEIDAGELFTHKKGSPERGKIWEAIQDWLLMKQAWYTQVRHEGYWRDESEIGGIYFN